MEQLITLPLNNVEQLIPSDEPHLLAAKAIDSDYGDFLFNEVNARASFNSTVKIEVKLPKDKISPSVVEKVEKHFKSYFSYKEKTSAAELSVLYRTGKNRALTSVVGIALILILASLTSSLITNEFFLALFIGIFTVMCWVSVWLPFQTFVFDKWPLKRQLTVYQKLSAAKIEVSPHSS